MKRIEGDRGDGGVDEDGEVNRNNVVSILNIVF